VDTDETVSADTQRAASDISPTVLDTGVQASADTPDQKALGIRVKVSVVDNHAMESVDNHAKASVVVDNQVKASVVDNQAMESVGNHAKASVVDIHAMAA